METTKVRPHQKNCKKGNPRVTRLYNHKGIMYYRMLINFTLFIQCIVDDQFKIQPIKYTSFLIKRVCYTTTHKVPACFKFTKWFSEGNTNQTILHKTQSAFVHSQHVLNSVEAPSNKMPKSKIKCSLGTQTHLCVYILQVYLYLYFNYINVIFSLPRHKITPLKEYLHLITRYLYTMQNMVTVS